MKARLRVIVLAVAALGVGPLLFDSRAARHAFSSRSAARRSATRSVSDARLTADVPS
jgi:hypothetical protein